jgi:hypothetical protein
MKQIAPDQVDSAKDLRPSGHLTVIPPERFEPDVLTLTRLHQLVSVKLPERIASELPANMADTKHRPQIGERHDTASEFAVLIH